MTDNLENDVTVGAQVADAPEHPQAGIASEGWSSPQADIATPGATFGKLVLKRSGAETDVEFPVNPPTTIGRFDPAVGPIDIDLGSLTPEGSYISRKHARILCEDGKFVIKDLGSSNGTFVLRDDFDRVDEAELVDGTEIAFGNARFVFHVTTAETPLAADPQS
jgi:pSer/pThr/pTyr-binding forkhead associated (FHA) protein